MTEGDSSGERPDLRVVGDDAAAEADSAFRLGRDSGEVRDLRRFSPKVRSAVKVVLMGRALELRVAGATYAQIGAALKCNDGSAWRYVRDALEQRAKLDVKNVDEYRAIQLERIRAGVLAIWPAYARGDGEAVRNMIRLINIESFLTGTRAPIKFDHAEDFVKIGRDLGLTPEEAVSLAEQLLAEDRANH